jgi:DNA mismatch repair ATPase MutS
LNYAAQEYCKTISEDYGKLVGFNDAANMITDMPESNTVVCSVRKGNKPDETICIIPTDKKGDRIGSGKKYTTQRVIEALDNYLRCVRQAERVVEVFLTNLNVEMQSKSVEVGQASHFSVVFESARLHTQTAKQRGWGLPTLIETSTPQVTLKNVFPFWMDKFELEGRGKGTVFNDVDLRELFLLTGPNMGGKSTLMRSVFVSALLANCGMFVPCDSANVSRFKHFVLKTGSSDAPSENMSSFALEVNDVDTTVRDSTEASLVMMDELGK